MTRADKALVILLRILGVTTLLALAAVVMPFSWMVEMHRWLGMGEMPTTPLLEYLARTASAFYAFFGALCLVVAADLARYCPLVRFLGASLTMMGMAFLGVDLAAGMPWWWSVCEGLPVLIGVLLFVLARQDHREEDTTHNPGTAMKG